ncbi:UNVERIFIED_CONTAM: hypothetical protein GTU68_041722 [Idotea baltica]|nr:hypothetical protein [Idotea baltica]
MRLGAYNCDLVKGTLAHEIYGKKGITERHRHRWEFNDTFKKDFVEAGMVISGVNPDNKLVEVIELPDHPFFIGVQFHPELKSTVLDPHPLFVSFIKAAIDFTAKKE